jgi:hypothetical protein
LAGIKDIGVLPRLLPDRVRTTSWRRDFHRGDHAQHCRAARIVAEIVPAPLATETGLSLDTIASFESGFAASDRETATASRHELE